MFNRFGRVCNSTMCHFDTLQRKVMPRVLVSATVRPNKAIHQSFMTQQLKSFTALTTIPLRYSIGTLSRQTYCDTLSRQQHAHSNLNAITKRFMGGGPRNEEHKLRLRAIRKARKIYFEAMPERPPKPPTCTKHYDEVSAWKTEPISKKIEHRVVHICSFIIYAWLNAYPFGSSLRKLQRDIAFRMQRKHRLPGKLPYQVIMPIVGKLERENYLKTKMKSNGHVLIYRDKEVNIVPEQQYEMNAISKADDDGSDNEDGGDYDDDDDHFDLDAEMEAVEEDKRNPTPIDAPYKPSTYRPKFSKEQKPKVKKVKAPRIKRPSDPVMEDIALPPGTQPTSRGPRFISPDRSE
jgi:hypothetical protein